jgi:predicted HicB family RNase H-like nuclease
MSISIENTRTNLTISKEFKSQLEEIAKQQNRSFNNLVITILKEYVEKISADNKK